jgi:glutaminyl-peptide cyclotransferase
LNYIINGVEKEKPKDTQFMTNLNERTRTQVRRSIGNRSLFSLCALLAPLLFVACPGGGATVERQSDNSGVMATASPSPSVAEGRQALSIDADRAFQLVKKQVDFGARPAGSAALARTREFIVNELKGYGLNVTLDEFQASTPVGSRPMTNIIAELPGESRDVIIVSSHYDTKEFDKFRFVGANDGASSTAVVMEMARVMAASKVKPHFTYWFTFFDGEEAFCAEWETCGNPDQPDHTYGSRHMVAQLIDRKELNRIKAMILLDMVGYKKQEFGRDDMSTTWLVDAVWNTAQKMGLSSVFTDRIEGVGGDDHEPFLRAGVDSLDIIQLNTYPYWHTKDDTLDKISPQSLKTVGDVVLASLPRIEERLAR